MGWMAAAALLGGVEAKGGIASHGWHQLKEEEMLLLMLFEYFL